MNENKITLMCPKCGAMAFAKDGDNSKDICGFCNTKRMQIDFPEGTFMNTPFDEIPIIEERLRRKYLYNNPLFNEEVFEARMQKVKEKKKK